MTSLQRFESVFEGKAIRELPIALCYESILVRDHFDDISDKPWEYFTDPDIEKRLLWHEGKKKRLSHDWVHYPFLYCVEDGAAPQNKPIAGGYESISGIMQKRGPVTDSREQIDMLVSELTGVEYPAPGPLSEKLKALYSDRPLLGYANTPFWLCFGIWDFEDLMTLTLDDTPLIAYTMEQFTKKSIEKLEKLKALGAQLIWVEECYADMLPPNLYESLNVTCAKELINAIRRLGMKSIYYYTGNPYGKLDMLLSTRADAYAFEESKKGFSTEITELTKKINGEFVLVSNIDAIGVLQNGTPDEIRREVRRHVEAAKANDGRFVIGLGSPVTPLTSMEKLMDFMDIAREEAVI